MSGLSSIQWTDRVWNPVVGCTKVSQGCKHCYAKTLHDKRHKAFNAGKLQNFPQYAQPFETVRLMPDRLTDPLSWRKPSRVFVNSVSDLFHEDVPDEFLDRVFAIMALATGQTFQVLTKRPVRMWYYMSASDLRARIAEQANSVMRSGARGIDDALAYRFLWRMIENAEPGEWANRLSGIADDQWPLRNVWLGTSVENQAAADERIPLLTATPAAIRFLSCEPLLGPLQIAEYLPNDLWNEIPSWKQPEIDWVIVGGESGKGAREFDLGWARSIVRQCNEAPVACFVKQLGARPVVDNDDDSELWPGASMPLAESYEPHHQGELAPLDLRNSHGGDWNEWPEDLRVREFPKAREAASV